MKRISMVVALLAGALLAIPALAQEPGQGYFAFGYGSARTDGASPYTNTQDDSSSGGLRLYAGKMIWKNFGLEVGYFDFGKFDVNFGGSIIAETKTAAATLAGVFVSPLGAGFSIRGRAGAVFSQARFNCVSQCGTGTPVNANTKQTDVSGMLGIGIGAKLAQDITLRLDYDHFGNIKHSVSGTGYNDSYDTVSLALQFNF
jgi:hypothetical protein